jgi:hypothetical protein
VSQTQLALPQRIQRKRTRGWRMPEGAVYVGRLPNGLGGWGNPYIVGEHQTRQQAVDNFRRALVDGRLQYSVAKVRRELAGRDLACWCPLDQPCHADVLLDLANRPQEPA